jgi:hypothetical protein
MPATFDMMTLSDQPMLALIGWSFVLGLILILPGALAATAGALRTLGRRLVDPPLPPRRRTTGLRMIAPRRRLVPRG